MTPLTLDLPPEMRARLYAEAKRRHVSESAFIQAMVAKALAGPEVLAPVKGATASASDPRATQRQPDFLGTAGDLSWSIEGPAELSKTGVSCLDLAGDLFGSVRSGNPDLATNLQYLEETIVKGVTRWRGDA